MMIARLPHRVFHAPRRSEGFSLIELMIAVLLGIVVVAGLINVLIANKQAYGLQQARNYNQENMRFALDRIGWSVRMAGFYGGATAVSGSLTITPQGNCNGTWVANATQSIHGYDGAASLPAALSGCVNATNYVPGSDILIVRHAMADAAGVASGSTAANSAPLSNGEAYLQVKSGSAGSLNTASGAVDLTGQPTGTSVYPYVVDMYYLRPCSDPGAGGNCSTSSDGGHPIPTLMDLHVDGSGNVTSDPVVEGIEQMQFEYGIGDPPSVPTPKTYESAAGVTDWSKVVSVRIAYVLRSQARDTRVPHTFDSGSTTTTATTYTTRLSNDCEYQVTATGTASVVSGCTGFNTATSTGNQPQQFVRSQMVAFAQLRNRVRGISP